MYFDFEDYHPDIARVGPALTRLEVVLLSIIFHLVLLLVVVLMPRWYPELFEPRPIPLQLAQAQPEDEATRFVFVEPRKDVPAPKPPERGPASDADRLARTPEQRPDADNMAPFMRGNSPELVERTDPAARGRGPEPDPAEGEPTPQPPDPRRGAPETPQMAAGPSALQLPDSLPGRSATSGGQLGDALRNLQRYVQQDTLNNPQGGAGQFGPEIQFDTKGVEFGPWVRRFVAQVKRNWLIPYSAMSMSGHVVITFNVHKDGALTDLVVVGPSAIEAFNNAAFGALASSNPTQPLPPEYPADRAFFTVTFFYNESPR